MISRFVRLSLATLVSATIGLSPISVMAADPAPASAPVAAPAAAPAAQPDKTAQKQAKKDKKAKKKAEMARKRLDDGRSFADAATEFSEGKTAGNGGDMGWFPYADLAASLQDAAKNQKIGVPGDVIESDLGFHILLINERKTENGKDLVELSQIFVKKKTFGDWLTSELQGMSIHVLAPEYEWNQDAARVEFHDPALRQFEANLLQNSQGDASVIF